MKGIILAGGSGTRLYPLTMATSKQLLPIYDKPMIYYPLSTLMLARIKDILLISTPEHTHRFRRLLGDGSNFGINLSYAVQPSPDGLAQAFLIGKDFIKNEPCALVLGDNIFYGGWFRKNLQQAVVNSEAGKATIFGYYVKNPSDFGVVEFNHSGEILSIEEKPKNPKSHYCVTGLYFYDKDVLKYVEQIKPSARGELEITDLNNLYLQDKKLTIQTLGRGFAWMDTGTINSLNEASTFIRSVQDKQGLLVSSPEEIAYHNGWIDRKQLLESATIYGKSSYGAYLREIALEQNY